MYLTLMYYSFLFKISLMWIVLSHVDRTHMRYRSRLFGLYIRSKLEFIFNSIKSKLNIDPDIVLNIDPEYVASICRPICILCEMFTGFVEGLENMKAVLSIEPKTDLNLVNVVNVVNVVNLKKDVESQTLDLIEPTPIIEPKILEPLEYVQLPQTNPKITHLSIMQEFMSDIDIDTIKDQKPDDVMPITTQQKIRIIPKSKKNKINKINKIRLVRRE